MKRICFILLSLVLIVGCAKEEFHLREDVSVTEEAESGDFDISAYEFVIDAVSEPGTKLTTSGAWQGGDVIYICVDGDADNVYKLEYSADNSVFYLYDVAGSSRVGFKDSGSVAGLHASSANLSLKSGTFAGSLNGDVVYTKSGSYTKSGKTITITMNLSQRPVSLVKISGAAGACYVENMKENYTSLLSLLDMSFDPSSAASSYVYDSASKTSYCYGVLPDDGILHLRYTGGDRKVFYRNSAVTALGPGEMTTIAGPETAPSDWMETIDFEHYETGNVITYMSSAKAAPLNLVITGDGFTVYDMKPEGTFYARAKYAVDELFKVEPFKTYKNYFNVYFIPAISNQRGADIGNTKKDTYFDTGWESGTSYSTMASSTGRSTAYNFFASHTPGYEASRTFGIVLCNESTYGAICYWDAPVLCYASVALNSSWTAPRSLAWSGNWDGDVKEAGYCRGDYSNLVLHELGGHGIGRLSDEYPSYNFSSWTVQYQQARGFSRNLSVGNTSTPWDSFKAAILAAGGYATGNAGIGEYECKNDIYRADFQGTMIDNRKTFGVWSRYLIAERIHSVAGESYSYDQFISEVPKQVYDDVWKSSRGASVKMVDEEELTFVPMPASPR